MRQDLTLDNLSICVSIFIKELRNILMRTIVTVLFNVICKLYLKSNLQVAGLLYYASSP